MEECLFSKERAWREILVVLRRNDADFAAKLLIRAINLESERKWLAEIQEIYRSQEKVQKKAANPHADQSKGLTAQNTAGTGRCDDYTTAPRQIQGGI